MERGAWACNSLNLWLLMFYLSDLKRIAKLTRDTRVE